MINRDHIDQYEITKLKKISLDTATVSLQTLPNTALPVTVHLQTCAHKLPFHCLICYCTNRGWCFNYFHSAADNQIRVTKKNLTTVCKVATRGCSLEQVVCLKNEASITKEWQVNQLTLTISYGRCSRRNWTLRSAYCINLLYQPPVLTCIKPPRIGDIQFNVYMYGMQNIVIAPLYIFCVQRQI